MHRWQIGDIDIVRINDFDLTLPSDERLPEWMVPSFGPSVDEFRVADSAIAIRDGETRIIADPWLLANRPRPDGAEASQHLLDQLAEAGFPAEQVDFVVNSHLDGVGWNTVPHDGGWVLAFPYATYLYPAEDVASVERGDDRGDDGAHFSHLASLTDITAVDGVTQLTPRVSIVPSGGHGVGHQVVRIEAEGDVAVYLGHIVVHPVQFPRPEVSLDRNLDEVPVRRHHLGALADQGGLAITTLVGGPGGGRIVRDGDGFRF